VVPKLGGASLALTKKLLGLLDCKAGQVKKATSKSVPKGDVISTSPGGRDVCRRQEHQRHGLIREAEEEEEALSPTLRSPGRSRPTEIPPSGSA
jgi:hypothetical protein